MKKIVGIFLAIGFCFMLISCSKVGQEVKESNDVMWSYLKSPNTGQCYELVTLEQVGAIEGYGYMGMSEIPCDKMPQKQ